LYGQGAKYLINVRERERERERERQEEKRRKEGRKKERKKEGRRKKRDADTIVHEHVLHSPQACVGTMRNK
jgi:hypothetical protein